jgi:hypothetical protein
MNTSVPRRSVALCIPGGKHAAADLHARSAIRVAHTDRALRAGRGGLVGAAGQPGDDLGDPGWGWGGAVRLGVGRFELRRPSSSAVVDLASFARRGQSAADDPKGKARRSHSLPLLTYSALGGLRQDPGRAAESSAGPRTDEDMGATTCVCCCRRTRDAVPDRWDWRGGCGRWARRCGCARRPTGRSGRPTRRGEGSER